ncbi:polysaccharide deacetylase family protein [Actinomadura barringtoniae]|uniref:Polysaccharide deacetylase family protein n=1 Tax=Actinomadura barringtoniae TaxID=1427535 RepID=A0A939PJ25_9ACTN|nr:polysaccharide deacetylase family protein [Actinomadura barringtoniae]MBO2450978.1 polysaccharide deacetylase family protein [Actinomadura barringtoniae]
MIARVKGVAALAAALVLGACADQGARQLRTVADVTIVHTVNPSTVPGLTTVTRAEQNDRRHVYASYPEVPGARPLSRALASAVNGRVKPFERDAGRVRRLPGGDVPELNVQWSLTAAAQEVVGVRLVTSQFMGASGGETRETLWYDGVAGMVHPAADLLDGRRGLDGMVRQVRSRIGNEANPGQVTPDPRMFSSIAFNEAGDMVVEFSDYSVAPGSAGRVAVAVPGSAYEPLLSSFGMRARDAALDTQPGLSLGSPTATPAPRGDAARRPLPRTDCVRAKCVALTFDDGPGPHTGRLLDLLADGRARATFFVVGDNAAARTDLLRRAAAAGHEIGNHTQDHRDLSRLPAMQVTSDIQRTEEVVRDVTGRSPKLLRPPYGATNATVGAVAKSLGLAQVMWNVAVADWRQSDARVIADRVVSASRPGSIVVLHDNHKVTVDAVPRIIQRLQAKGYTLATASDLLAARHPQPGGAYRNG